MHCSNPVQKSAINFVTGCSVIIVTLVFKYIKSTTELIFIILLRHMGLIEVINLKYLFAFIRCQVLRKWFCRRWSLWCTIQSSVLAASSCRTEGSSLLEQTKAPRKWGLVPLVSQAAVASCNPNSYSSCRAPVPSLSSPRGAGVWLPVLIASHKAVSKGKGAHNRPGREIAEGRCWPPYFWQTPQIFNGCFEFLMVIQKQCSQMVLSWSVLEHSLSLQVSGMLSQDYKPSASVPSLPCPSLLQSLLWLNML